MGNQQSMHWDPSHDQRMRASGNGDDGGDDDPIVTQDLLLISCLLLELKEIAVSMLHALQIL